MLIQSIHAPSRAGGFEWNDHAGLHAFFTSGSRASRGQRGPSSLILDLTEEDIEDLIDLLWKGYFPVSREVGVSIARQKSIAEENRGRDRGMCDWALKILRSGGIVTYTASWGTK
ncbi:hypothetical protein [Roseobacter sp. HKCCA0434]|uniref:hypothetical protein n=1 Tax=Roseobacter sp. HKCCA0434 TaxID=3079297 RepID=UPI002905E0B8|nr:hypothetical protein [Roseobacter sp. HKCCA0434]